MVRHQRVVVRRRHETEARNTLARERKLHAERIGHESTDQAHGHPGEHVLHRDHLVIGRKHVFLEEGRVVVIVMIVVTSAYFMGNGLSHRYSLTCGTSKASFVLVFAANLILEWSATQAACCSGVSMKMRAPIMP